MITQINYEKAVNDLFEEILLRKPDKIGLFYFTSQLKNNKLTLNKLREILSGSEEGQAIKNFSHYSDKYWNDIERVAKYKNKLATDNENIDWISDIPNRFGQFLQFKEVLIVGCGNGWLERKLVDLGIGLHFDAFDISEKYLEEAKEKKGSRPIDYFIEDVNEMSSIKNEKYDAVFNFAILHHSTKIDNAIKRLSEILKPDGLIFNEEYVGPARNQYSDNHVRTMIEVMSDLPEKYRSPHVLRPPLANFRVEPTEAIHSDLVRQTFEKYFDIIYQRNLNGGIAYQILWNNIEKFQDLSNKDALKWLEFLLEHDYEKSKENKVPILFWYGVGRPKRVKK